MAKDEIAAANAVAEESETSTDKVEAGSKEEQGKASNEPIPYDRFKEVVDQKNEFKEKFDALEAESQDRTKELGQMVALLEAREGDTQLVNSIRALAAGGNPEHRDLVQNLDNILQGIEKSIEKGDKTPEQAAVDTKSALAATQEAMEDIAGEQQAELLLMKADILAEKYFDALPPEYSDQDKEIISTLLTDAVDWEAIEEDPNALSEVIPASFEKVLQFFGEPRGKPAAEVKGEETKQTATVAEPVAEAEVPQHLKTEWGELKEVTTPKGTVLKPVQSEEDFRKGLAEELKRINQV